MANQLRVQSGREKIREGEPIRIGDHLIRTVILPAAVPENIRRNFDAEIERIHGAAHSTSEAVQAEPPDLDLWALSGRLWNSGNVISRKVRDQVEDLFIYEAEPIPQTYAQAARLVRRCLRGWGCAPTP